MYVCTLPFSFLSRSLVICAGTHGVQMGTSPPTNNSVLPGCICDLRRIYARVWLQTPLEWCPRGSLAGGAHRRSQCKFDGTLFKTIVFYVKCILDEHNWKWNAPQVRYVSDFFKERLPRQQHPEMSGSDESERKPSLQIVEQERNHHCSFSGTVWKTCSIEAGVCRCHTKPRKCI